MLTFKFTGAEGEMTVEEVLTSGMVGKKAVFQFSDDWRGANKTAVFVAGSVCHSVVLEDNTALTLTITIPEEVLAHPCQRLYAGVWGINDAGDYVLPTVMAKGPLIRFGADPSIE